VVFTLPLLFKGRDGEGLRNTWNGEIQFHALELIFTFTKKTTQTDE